MAKYFNYFPKTFYTSNNDVNGVEAVTNIIARFAFDSQLKENTSAVEYHWVVLLFNNIIDPQFDWPLKSDTLIDYIDKKYTANGSANTPAQSGLTWALSENNVQGYFKVVTTTANDGTITQEKITIDANTYANVATGTNTYTTQAGESVKVVVTKETQSYYTYETNLNESKREINLIKSDFLPQIEKEFKRVISL